MKFQSDIDVDFGDRTKILEKIRHIRASIDSNTHHNTGIYVTEIPHDPITNTATIDYKTAENRGYIKLDLLNVNIYAQITSEQELVELMNQTPPWHKLQDKLFCKQLIHIGNHWDTLSKMPEPVDNIEKLSMFLAVIRPGKRHLIGSTWKTIADSIWDPPSDGYYFKHSHSVAYAHLVVVHMNLLNRSTN